MRWKVRMRRNLKMKRFSKELRIFDIEEVSVFEKLPGRLVLKKAGHHFGFYGLVRWSKRDEVGHFWFRPPFCVAAYFGMLIRNLIALATPSATWWFVVLTGDLGGLYGMGPTRRFLHVTALILNLFLLYSQFASNRIRSTGSDCIGSSAASWVRQRSASKTPSSFENCIFSPN